MSPTPSQFTVPKFWKLRPSRYFTAPVLMFAVESALTYRIDPAVPPRVPSFQFSVAAIPTGGPLGTGKSPMLSRLPPAMVPPSISAFVKTARLLFRVIVWLYDESMVMLFTVTVNLASIVQFRTVPPGTPTAVNVMSSAGPGACVAFTSPFGVCFIQFWKLLASKSCVLAAPVQMYPVSSVRSSSRSKPSFTGLGRCRAIGLAFPKNFATSRVNMDAIFGLLNRNPTAGVRRTRLTATVQCAS